MDSKKKYIFQFDKKKAKRKLVYYLAWIILLGIVYIDFLIFLFEKESNLFLLILIPVLMFVPIFIGIFYPVFLIINYSRHDKDIVLIIDKEKEMVKYIKHGIEREIKFSDIISFYNVRYPGFQVVCSYFEIHSKKEDPIRVSYLMGGDTDLYVQRTMKVKPKYNLFLKLE